VNKVVAQVNKYRVLDFFFEVWLNQFSMIQGACRAHCVFTLRVNAVRNYLQFRRNYPKKIKEERW
jgi:hypothetical protein